MQAARDIVALSASGAGDASVIPISRNSLSTAATFAIAAVLAVGQLISPGRATAETLRAYPLATTEQNAAETRALRILASPEVKSAQDAILPQLLADPVSATPEGRTSARTALGEWTAYLVLQTVLDPERPSIVWETDDIPHTWFGHTFPKIGLEISNPDNVYRVSILDGGSHYEITGHQHAPIPSQMSLELSANHLSTDDLKRQSPKFGDLGYQMVMLTDKDLQVDPDGTFKIYIDSDPANGRANHIQSGAGELRLHIRESLADWAQSPASLTVERVAGPAAQAAATDSELIQRVVAALPNYITYWQTLKDKWLGGPAYNTLVGPLKRDGGWGYTAASRFKIANDDAIVLTVRDGEAHYFAVQFADLWMMTPDPAHRLSSLNKAQSVANPDGSYTYVFAARDPGVANWVDTAGLHSGWLQVRWQGAPQTTQPDTLVSSFKIVSWRQLRAALPPTIKRFSPEQRSRQLQLRGAQYDQRTAGG